MKNYKKFYHNQIKKEVKHFYIIYYGIPVIIFIFFPLYVFIFENKSIKEKILICLIPILITLTTPHYFHILKNIQNLKTSLKKQYYTTLPMHMWIKIIKKNPKEISRMKTYKKHHS